MNRSVKPMTGDDSLEGDLKTLRRKTHQTIRKVTIDIEDRFHFNTAISALWNWLMRFMRFPSDAKDKLHWPS